MKNLQPQITLTSLLAAACVALAGAVLAVAPAPDVGYLGQKWGQSQWQKWGQSQEWQKWGQSQVLTLLD